MKLSIVTINYNNCSGLQKTMNSIFSQTYRDFEWIVIDGGSTDGSKELIEQNKQFFSYWCSEPDNGVYHAQNKGIEHSHGEFISFMNSGDFYYDNNVLMKSTPYLEGSADLLYGDWCQVYPSYEKLVHIPVHDLLSILLEQNICHQAMFVRAKILKERGYDQSMKILADWKRLTEIILSGSTICSLPFCICKYGMDGISSCCDKDLLNNEYQQVMSVYPPLLLAYMKENNNPYMKITKKLLYGNYLFQVITKLFLKSMSLFVKVK